MYVQLPGENFILVYYNRLQPQRHAAVLLFVISARENFTAGQPKMPNQ